MKKSNIFPIIYAIISAILTFIAVFFILFNTFHINLSFTIFGAALIAVISYVYSYFRAHASAEIKRIVYQYGLNDAELAKMTRLKKSDFPIYQDKLQLILPKRMWPRVLHVLQEYEQKQQSKE